jgi:hypothetical protein
LSIGAEELTEGVIGIVLVLGAGSLAALLIVATRVEELLTELALNL